MATYSDNVVSIQTGTGTYTCPTGKYARVSLRADTGTSPVSIAVAGKNIFDGQNGSPYHYEVILAAGETIVIGASDASWTALEYSAP